MFTRQYESAVLFTWNIPLQKNARQSLSRSRWLSGAKLFSFSPSLAHIRSTSWPSLSHWWAIDGQRESETIKCATCFYKKRNDWASRTWRDYSFFHWLNPWCRTTKAPIEQTVSDDVIITESPEQRRTDKLEREQRLFDPFVDADVARRIPLRSVPFISKFSTREPRLHYASFHLLTNISRSRHTAPRECHAQGRLVCFVNQ